MNPTFERYNLSLFLMIFVHIGHYCLVVVISKLGSDLVWGCGYTGVQVNEDSAGFKTAESGISLGGYESKYELSEHLWCGTHCVIFFHCVYNAFVIFLMATKTKYKAITATRWRYLYIWLAVIFCLGCFVCVCVCICFMVKSASGIIPCLWSYIFFPNVDASFTNHRSDKTNLWILLWYRVL